MQNQIHVLDAALGAGGDEARIGLDRLFDLFEFLQLDHRADVGPLLQRDEAPFGERHHATPDADAAPGIDVEPRLALDGIARTEAAHHRLVGFLQLDHLESDAFVALDLAPSDLCGQFDLVLGQRRQGMAHRCR